MINAFYRKDFLTGKYLDPFNNFSEKEIVFEIRQDGITGTLCRLLPTRYRRTLKPQVGPYLERQPESKCPFCPGLLEKITPRFTPDVHPDGKFRRGSAVLFPNAFPHDRFNCVALFSERHYVPLPELTVDLMLDGFLLCRDYFAGMKALHPELQFASINWNYMPPAGGGQIHPHLQTLVAERPTRYAEMLQGKACHYQELTMGNLWRDILAYEKEKEERYIGSTEGGGREIGWFSAFAPRGMAGEIGFIFQEARSLSDLGEADFRALTEGLVRVFRHLSGRDLISFNMSLFAALEECDDLWVQGTIIPRFVVLPLEASDINYFEKIHDEVICPVVPEEVCRELKGFFT